MARLVKVATVEQLPVGKVMTVEVDGDEIALFNVDGKLYAINNTCSHQGGPLGEGEVDDNIVTCPWHGWQYDVTTGTSTNSPDVRIPTYPVVVEGDDIKLSIEE